MKKTGIDLVTDIQNPSPDYYCTWQTQLFATSDGKPENQRRAICERSLFDTQFPYGWAYFYEQARRDLFLVMDDSWDVPLSNDGAYFGSLLLDEQKFPTFTKNTDNPLSPLVSKLKGLGWKGLGLWVCAQESPLYSVDKSEEEYWVERFCKMKEAGVSYWKVDWGAKALSVEFRKMLTSLAKTHAPNLIVEHSLIKEIIPFTHTFRTYDVPSIMSIPMTLEKLVSFTLQDDQQMKYDNIINCEDEAYIAAAGGYAMGIMRHPYAQNLPDGREDMSFPNFHRKIKTKMYEIIRAARWHRIAPAFSGGSFSVSETVLSDSWKFIRPEIEIEDWWFNVSMVKDFITDGVLTKSAPAIIARNTQLPKVSYDKSGNICYCIASQNPNGVYSVATLGRTSNQEYFLPKCDVEIYTKNADTIGIFGEYSSLTAVTDATFDKVFMQDLADDESFDVTEHIIRQDNRIIISGDLISQIGRLAQPDGDTSEPGVLLKLIKK
ncbi:MAG: hypothetical protein IJ462_03475 [Clostridia bacterium]|nr:hypothetical protein [Clostridia bacterium]